MSDAFPEIPRGEPGGVRATAQDFVRAALGVADTAVQLRAGASTMDWYGVAQSQYIASSGRLAKAIDRYADDLDGAQRELRRLQRIVDDLRQEAASHRATAQGLANTRAHAPVTVAGLDDNCATGHEPAAEKRPPRAVGARRGHLGRCGHPAGARARRVPPDACGRLGA